MINQGYQRSLHIERAVPARLCMLDQAERYEVLAVAQMRRAHKRAQEDRAVIKMGKATVVAKPEASPQSVLELSSYSSDENV